MYTTRFIEKYKSLKEKGIISTDAEFVETIGWNTSSLSQVLNGRRGVPLWVVRDFCKRFEIPIESLLEDNSKITAVNTPTRNHSPSMEWILYVSKAVAKTYCQFCSDEEYIRTLPKWVIPSVQQGDTYYRAFEIDTELLIPNAFKSDTAIAKYIAPSYWKFVPIDSMVAIVVEDEIIMRKIEKNTGISISLYSSMNNLLPPREVSYGEITELWEIRYVVCDSLDSPLRQVIDKLQGEIDELREMLNQKPIN